MASFFARRNALVGAIVLLVAIVYGYLTAGLPNRSLPNTPGPSFFPWLITGGLALLSLALIVQSVRSASPDETVSIEVHGYKTLALAGFLAYIVVLPYAGFVASTVPFFAGMMWLYGERRALVVAVGAVAVPVGCYYLFRAGFSILLPAGAW